MWVHEDIFPGDPISPFGNWVACPGVFWDYGGAQVYRPADTRRELSTCGLSYDEVVSCLAGALPEVQQVETGTLSHRIPVKNYSVYGKRENFFVAVNGKPGGVVQRLCINLVGFVKSEPARPDEIQAIKELFGYLAGHGDYLFYHTEFQCLVSDFEQFERFYQERYVAT